MRIILGSEELVLRPVFRQKRERGRKAGFFWGFFLARRGEFRGTPIYDVLIDDRSGGLRTKGWRVLKDSRLPAEFEITEHCYLSGSGKENILIVQVMRWSDGSYPEDQDQWWLSGIHRDVILLSKPRVFEDHCRGIVCNRNEYEEVICELMMTRVPIFILTHLSSRNSNTGI